jgi:TonB family protein
MNTKTIRGDWAGQVIDGRFTLLKWLGGTEWSGVFLTELRERGAKKAAIKLIPADAGDEEARIAGWSAATKLSHPHLMPLFHYGRCQIGAVRMLYAVTEYAEEILSQILPQRPLTPTEAGEMLAPVLDALSYLHRKGYVHGSLNPSNIMAVDDRLKLSCDRLQVAGELGGRLPAKGVYEPPECVAGTISPAADLWSLGVTLVESLTQHPPVWDRSIHREPTVPESIPQPIAGIVRDCLRSDPGRRCTLSDIKARLAPARSPLGLASGIVKMLVAKFQSLAIVAAVLVLFAAIAFFELRSHQTEASPPAAEQQPVPVERQPAAAVAIPPPSPAPITQSPKGAAAKGEVATRVLPDVPERAGQTIHGKVQVSIRVAVDPGGAVSDAALESPGSSKYFASLALEAARRWKFKPAQADGRAVSSVWLLRFEFGQAGTEVTPVETTP